MPAVRKVTENGEHVYPLTHQDAVIDSNGIPVGTKIETLDRTCVKTKDFLGTDEVISEEQIIAQLNELGAKIESLNTRVNDPDEIILSDINGHFTIQPKTIENVFGEMKVTLDGKLIELQKSAEYIQWKYLNSDNWTNLIAINELKGNDGINGLDGVTPNLSIGTVSTLQSDQNATAEITGSSPNLTLNLGIPKGETGNNGTTDQTLVTTPILNEVLALTTDKLQTASVIDGTEITLPVVNDYTEIHLFFNATTDMNLVLPIGKYQSTPVITANKVYEFIFTFVNGDIGWLIGYVEYA